MSTSSNTTRRQRRPSHPGAAIAEALDGIDGMSISKAARDMGVSRQHLHNVINGERPVTPEFALRVGKFLGNGPGVWLRMQQAVDLWDAEHKLADELKAIKRAEAA